MMVYRFAHIGAALAMKGQDVYSERRRFWWNYPDSIEGVGLRYQVF
jgi:hypothetical protein